MRRVPLKKGEYVIEGQHHGGCTGFADERIAGGSAMVDLGTRHAMADIASAVLAGGRYCELALKPSSG